MYVGTDIIKYPFKVIHNELGIKNCRFYDLRRSYATQILRKEAEIRDVADILEKVVQSDIINEITKDYINKE